MAKRSKPSRTEFGEEPSPEDEKELARLLRIFSGRAVCPTGSRRKTDNNAVRLPRRCADPADWYGHFIFRACLHFWRQAPAMSNCAWKKLEGKIPPISSNEKDAVRLLFVCRRGVKLGGPPREDQFGPANMPLKLSHALGQLRKLGLDRRWQRLTRWRGWRLRRSRRFGLRCHRDLLFSTAQRLRLEAA
jgi:hypothetical protein